MEAMIDSNLEVSPQYIVKTDINKPDVNSIMRVICGGNGREGADGVLCMADSLLEATLQVLSGLSKESRCIVGGFSDARIDGFVSLNDPCLIEPNYKQIGVAAANKLIDVIEHKSTNHDVDIIPL